MLVNVKGYSQEGLSQKKGHHSILTGIDARRTWQKEDAMPKSLIQQFREFWIETDEEGKYSHERDRPPTKTAEALQPQVYEMK